MIIGTKSIDKQNQRTIPITLEMVKNAYKLVRSRGKAAGIDGITLRQFQEKTEGNLYVVYNRMSSGSYFPPAVRGVSIPKRNGKMRNLGIPTVRDRVAQTVIKQLIEPRIDNRFCEESYGCRPNKSAHQALDKVRKSCWKQAWVIDMDIKDFFNTIDHELLIKAIDKHVTEKWIRMYIKRWLEAPTVTTHGVTEANGKGTPQGGVLSPLLANLFMHYVFDKWMKRYYPNIQFTRYMDDIVVHCASKKQAQFILMKIRKRLNQCKLVLNEEKTCLVYCKKEARNESYPKVTFDFLGYTFKPRSTQSLRNKRKFLGFDAAISMKSQKKIVEEMRAKRRSMNNCKNLEEIAKLLNPSIRGWVNYYGYIGKSGMSKILIVINLRIVRWLKTKYKRLKASWKKSFDLYRKIKTTKPGLFAHWATGFQL